MTRRQLREQIFAMLFEVEFFPKDKVYDQMELYSEGIEGASEEDRAYILNKGKKIFDMLETIDNEINSFADKWTTGRMGKAEVTVLRLAVYELKYDDEIPPNVAINEGVELAKKYGQEDAGSFVNGVLAKLV